MVGKHFLCSLAYWEYLSVSRNSREELRLLVNTQGKGECATVIQVSGISEMTALENKLWGQIG